MMNLGEKLENLIILEKELQDKSTKSKITRFRSRFVEKSRSENHVNFFNTMREKTKIKSKINLIYDSKLKSDAIGRNIGRNPILRSK